MSRPKKLGKVQTVDLETGKVTHEKRNAFTLLPPAGDVCQECATAHDHDQPHNQQSLYWQMACAWVAGWFDGEGSFVLGIQTYKGKRQFYLRVSAANTHRPSLERIKSIFGGEIKAFPARTARLLANPRHSMAWVWLLHGHRNVLDFCKAVKPHLYEKLQEAEVIEAFCTRRIRQRRATPMEEDFAFVSMFRHARKTRKRFIPRLYQVVSARMAIKLMREKGVEVPADLLDDPPTGR